MMTAALACFNRIQRFLLSESRRDRRLPLNASISDENISPERVPGVRQSNAAHELHDLGGLSTVAPGTPLVVITHGSFGWNNEQAPVLRDISVSIRKFQTTFIIGHVGCGKTTLMKAMLGEIQPFRGSVYSGIDNVAYVSQNPWILNLSILENIVGVSSYERDWYGRVLEACGLEQDIHEMPDGDSTKAGSSGVSLSGGQRQRLALARAVYSREKVVFLDDVVSGQDAATESHIQRSLFGERGLFRQMGTTVVCISSKSKLSAVP